MGLFMVTILLLTTSTLQGRAFVKSALFIPQVLPDIPVRPLEYVTKPPIREKITFTTLDADKASADLYLPKGENSHPAVVFFMGVVPPDRDESRIVALAEGLARTGMVVMIPWLETQHQNRIVEKDIESLVDAFIYLENHPRVKLGKIGMGGICTGASMSIVASQDLRINDRVSFVNSFAGYYDAADFIVATAAKTRFDEVSSTRWNPDSLTQNLITTHIVDGAFDKDQVILNRIIKTGEWTQQDSDDLSSSGRAVLTLISGPNVDAAREAITSLNSRTTQFLENISPSTNIGNLKAEVLLMHDSSDKLVPPEESRRFAKAIESNGRRVYHTEFSLFQRAVQVHMDDAKGLNTLDFLKQAGKLYIHMYNVMRLSE
jgi:dienelactone hydrolase